MIGILSAGGCVPRYRLSGKALGAVWGGGGSVERAVAGYDEDSLTMACEAALNALHGRDVTRIGACFLASTSAPYAEKSSAAILATVADLSPAVLTADLGGSLRCGTTALRLAPQSYSSSRPALDAEG
jgi:3-hydroxy-3-methylglutaryl CoA synthase